MLGCDKRLNNLASFSAISRCCRLCIDVIFSTRCSALFCTLSVCELDPVVCSSSDISLTKYTNENPPFDDCRFHMSQVVDVVEPLSKIQVQLYI